MPTASVPTAREVCLRHAVWSIRLKKVVLIMNDTKWTEIFKAFYYGIECSDDAMLANLQVLWTTKSINGDVYSDSTWTHFGCSMEHAREIEWLRINLTHENRQIVLDILRKIHVPGEVFDDHVMVYGYRTDVDYII